ncbi:hypothetical protein [Sphingomonas sp. KC8]|uniref:hypothetical protein n=1 Tax=Sphingomonas sp. KC8 TaxID=1030157 RepID=UPI00024897CC|nr:hypothetical protein [Sphingomonas sp. KC8]ARS29088.1 hypothetical protein KC8_17600 [Sphingomonas sp. KC8]
MSKFLRTAAFVVGAVALVVATAGIGAAPAIGAAGAGLGAGGGAAAAGVAAVSANIAGISAATMTAIASGLSAAAALTAKKPSVSGGGAQSSFKADPSAGIPYAMGRTSTGGNIVFHRAADGWSGKTNNDLSDFVAILSGAGPIDAIESFQSDGVAVTFDASGNAIPSDFRDFMFQKWQLGASPEATAINVSAGYSARPSGWTTSHKLSGYAAAMLRLRYDSKGRHYQNGTPQPAWVLRGVKVYDPRLDSTYPGGSGACRALNEATYVYSENPYLHALTWCLGRYQNNVRILGVGAPVAAIDVAAFVEGANIADANGWKVGGVVYSTDTKWEVLKAILQAGGGEPMRLGAKISCLINTPRVSLATVTVDDVVGEVSVQATQPQRDRINGVVPRYREPNAGWEIVPAAPVRVADYVTLDGGQRTKEIEYSLVQNLNQAVQLARYDIENAREFGPITLPLKLRWMGYKPGDCVTVVTPEVGLDGQLVLLLNRALEPTTGIVTLTGRSETAGKHPFALGQTGVAPATPSVVGPPLVPTPTTDEWTISDNKLAGDGVDAPAVVVVGAADPSIITAIIFEYRVYTGTQGADDDWKSLGVDPPDTTNRTITAILGTTQYQVSIRYRIRDSLGARLILGPVTTVPPKTGLPGVAGLNNATVFIYRRAASAPTLPSTTATYTFATAAITGLNNGWTATIPAGSNPLYVSAATASASAATDTIAAGEWATPVVLAQDGSTGLNAATIYLYQRNNSGTAPAAPTTTLTYTFASGVLSGTLGAWTQSVPAASGGKYLFVTTATALGVGATDAIVSGEWATVNRMAADGADAPPVMSIAVASLNLAAEYGGAIKTGQLPRTVQATMRNGATDVSSTTSWSVAPSAAITATINASGLVTITAAAGSGWVDVTGTYGGIATKQRLSIAVIADAAPPAAATSLSAGLALTNNDASFAAAPFNVLTLSASGAGHLRGILALAYDIPIPGTGTRTWTGAAKLVFRAVGGGAWSDFSGGAVNGSLASAIGGTTSEAESGFLSLDQTQTGLTAGASYEVGWMYRRVSGNYTSGSVSTSGSLTVRQP